MTYFQFVHAVEMKVKECAAEDLSVYVHRSEERRVGKECM